MIVLQVCNYGADYPGNFIASLEALEATLKKNGISTIYAFVEGAKSKLWCKKIQERTKVYFLPQAKARIKRQTYSMFRRIYCENKIDIVHTHFELYDIPATVMAPEHVKIFWHLHDPIVPGGGLHGLLWRYQYGVVGKKVKLISVADYYREIVTKIGFPATQASTLLNCIDLSRIRDCSQVHERHFDFLTFGWDFRRKGDDLILNACKRLAQEGYSFRLLLNGVQQTWPILDEFLGEADPVWLVRGKPTEDVNMLFADSMAFIQASRRETFSYAVCEAAYAGLPVISSDIPGLEWAHDLPTVRFFESENVDQLYTLMKSVLDDGTCLDANIETSRQMIRRRYSLDAWVQKVLEIYGLKV